MDQLFTWNNDDGSWNLRVPGLGDLKCHGKNALLSVQGRFSTDGITEQFETDMSLANSFSVDKIGCDGKFPDTQLKLLKEDIILAKNLDKFDMYRCTASGFPQTCPVQEMKIYITAPSESHSPFTDAMNFSDFLCLKGEIRLRSHPPDQRVYIDDICLLEADVSWAAPPPLPSPTSTLTSTSTPVKLSNLHSEMHIVHNKIKRTELLVLICFWSSVVLLLVPRVSQDRIGGCTLMLCVLFYMSMMVSLSFDGNALLGKQAVAKRYLSMIGMTISKDAYHRQHYHSGGLLMGFYMVLLTLIRIHIQFVSAFITTCFGIESKLESYEHDGCPSQQVDTVFVNGWNAWSFSGSIQEHQMVPRYAMPDVAVRSFHSGGAFLIENDKVWNKGYSTTGRYAVASEMFSLLVHSVYRSTTCESSSSTSSSSIYNIRDRKSSGWVCGYLSQRQQFGCIIISEDRDSLRVLCSCNGMEAKRDASILTDWFSIHGQPDLHDEPLHKYLCLSGRVNEVNDLLNSIDVNTISSASGLPNIAHADNESSNPNPNPKTKTKTKNTNLNIPAGWCSWYHFFEHISLRNLTENIENMATLCRNLQLDGKLSGFNLFQIDDGYQIAWGDWLTLKPSTFPTDPTIANHDPHAPIKELVSQISDNEFTPGLWLAPFTCDKASTLQREHPEWILRHRASGKPLNSANCGKWFYGLDVTNPEVRAHIKRTVHTIIQKWKFQYIKIDFLYIASLHGANRSYSDPSYTTAQAFQLGMHAVTGKKNEEGVNFEQGQNQEQGLDQSDSESSEVDGNEILLQDMNNNENNNDRNRRNKMNKWNVPMILGCGAPLGGVLGHVHANRISCDAGLSWFPDFPLPFWDQWNLPSARTMIRNTLNRLPMHRRWWINDPDCMILRKTGGASFSEDEVWGLAVVKAMSGGSFVLSDDLKCLTNSDDEDITSRLRLLQQILPISGSAATAVDLLDRDISEILRLNINYTAAPTVLNMYSKCLATTLALGNWGEYDKQHVLSALQIFGKQELQKVRKNVKSCGCLDGILLVVDLRRNEHFSTPLSLYYMEGTEGCLGTSVKFPIIPPHSANIFSIRWIPVTYRGVGVYLGSNLHFTGSTELLEVFNLYKKALNMRLTFDTACVRNEEWGGCFWFYFPGTVSLNVSGDAMTSPAVVEEIATGTVWKIPVCHSREGHECSVLIQESHM
jgi:hypothetical protein